MEEHLAIMQLLLSVTILNQLATLYNVLQNVQDDVGENTHMNCVSYIHIIPNIDTQLIF